MSKHRSGLKRFKGTASQYRTLHIWVAKHLGKPMKCSICGYDGPARYEWSNISNEYKKDLSDWRRLCKPCHTRIDNQWASGKVTHCTLGHELTPENIYAKPNKRGGECRTCRRASHARSNAISNPKRDRSKHYEPTT